MNYPPIVHTVVSKLHRAELAGVSAHTLPIAVDRAVRDAVPFETLNERQIAIALLERLGYPESTPELELFLKPAAALATSALIQQEIIPDQAAHYVKWLAAFLNDPDNNIQK